MTAISRQPPYTATSGLKELAPSLALGTACTGAHLLSPTLVASSTLSCVMVCFSHRCDRPQDVHMPCRRHFPGCRVLAPKTNFYAVVATGWPLLILVVNL